jgi:hypothetical protein
MDRLKLRRIFAYRNAQMARDLWESKDKTAAFETLSANPALLDVLVRMNRAQMGQPLDGAAPGSLAAEALAVAEAARGPDDEDE